MAPQVSTRKLGKNGPHVPAIGLGLMGIGAFYGAVGSDEKRFEVLDRAHELGQTFWDTADMYMDSETLIGKWFKRTGKRNDIFLATKVPILPFLPVLWWDGHRMFMSSANSDSVCKQAPQLGS